MTDWLWQPDGVEARETKETTPQITFGRTIKQTLYREQANWFLWLPVGMALGCAAYFSLSVEPSSLLAVSVLYIDRKSVV